MDSEQSYDSFMDKTFFSSKYSASSSRFSLSGSYFPPDDEEIPDPTP